MSTQPEPQFEQGCAFPDGVIHDHGNAQCHAATAVKAAQTSVAAFLHGLAGGEEVGICRNRACRVSLFSIEAGLGTKIPTCPACYWAPLPLDDKP